MTNTVFLPHAAPEFGREPLELPEGLTLAQIVEIVAPGLTAADRAQIRVTLATGGGMAQVSEPWWGQVKPKPGVQVIVRLVPGGDGLRSVLLAVVSIAAMALAPAVAGWVGLAGSKLAVSAIGMGLNLLGAALVNSIIPPVTPDTGDGRKTKYTVSGWQNRARPDEPVPWILGKHRYAPPYAATPYTQIVGDDQFTIAVFLWGYGRVNVSDLKIGEASIDDYDDVEIQHREGVEGDEPISLYPRQVLEDGESVELVRPWPRDDKGEAIKSEGTVETPVIRRTASSTQIASLIFWFPSGLIYYNGDGEEKTLKVEVRIRQRLSSSDPWDDVATLRFTGKKDEPFFRQHTWQLPSRGRWYIEVTRMTDERTNSRYVDRVVLAAVQSIRPEYPINCAKPLALTGVRIRATWQLTGQLDTLNGLVQRYVPVWDGETWSEGFSSNPASAAVATLQGNCHPYPAADAEVDWDWFQEFSEFCDARGLKYDRVHEARETLGEVLKAIYGAGRAAYRHDGVQWTGVIDRPQELVVDHLSIRNCSDFRWRRDYLDPPHAIRVTFNDASDDYEEAVRIIRWPGYTGEIDITEEMTHPGKTDPEEIYVETIRRAHEIEQRPDTFTCFQDGAARVATRGDLVMASIPVLERSQLAARVRSVEGALVVLDAPVTMEAGQSYGLRYRVYEDEEDSIGTSMVAAVAFSEGETRLLRLLAVTLMPTPGDVVHFGLSGEESHAMIVTGIEPGKNLGARLTLKLAAPEIDALTDATEVPDWEVTVGDPIAISSNPPLVPRFLEIDSDNYTELQFLGYGLVETRGEDPIVIVRLGPGEGETEQLSHYILRHRLDGAIGWTELVLWVADAGTELTGYSLDDVVELQAWAVTLDGTAGTATAIVTHVAGGDSSALASGLDEEAISVTGGLGHAQIELAVTDSGTAFVQLYRVASGGTLDTATDAVGEPLAVTPGLTVSIVDGDATRVTLVENGDFATMGSWTATNWSISTGSAAHSVGFTDALSQAVALSAGVTYRLALTVSGRTAGSVTPAFTGGTTVSGSAKSSNGTHFLELTAASGNDTLELQPSSDFDGAVTLVVLFRKTSACAPAGAWDYYLAPQNVENVESAAAGPFSTTIY